jgi:cellulose synthase/poly-beta-1,6-N-acetylglucosamine synthase-like glycosyltransferase
MTFFSFVVAVFWLCALGAIYSYIIYPLTLRLVQRRPRLQITSIPQFAVSLIIACRNESTRLRKKIEESLAIDYSGLEIIVASDCSNDGSDEIAGQYAASGVKLARAPERRGKEYAQGLAVAAARGDILVFSDAGTHISRDSITNLVRNFADPAVGAVSSEDQFVSAQGETLGEGAYVRYEMWLRRLESERAGIVGLSGSFFAVRRSIIRSWRDDIPSDFACALAAVRAGTIAISDGNVRGIYRDIADPRKEYGRKVRTAIRGMTALAQNLDILNVTRYGWFSYQVFSHKLARWVVPWCMLGLLLTGGWLAMYSDLYAFLFAAQVCLYAAALAAFLSPALRRFTVMRLLYYFVQVNVAVAEAGARFAKGTRIVVWDPSRRQVD